MAIGANDFLKDVIGACSPDKRLGIFVMHDDAILDCADQFRDAAEHAAAQTFGCDVTEEALNHVQPGCRGRREMHMKPRMFLQPLLDVGMLVRCMVVADQMQYFILGCFPVNLTQEIEPFAVVVVKYFRTQR